VSVDLGGRRIIKKKKVNDALAAMDDTTFYVAVLPDADPRLDELLAERELEPGWGWMVFERGPLEPPDTATTLSVVDADPGSAAAWAEVVLEAYGLPPECAPMIEAVPSTTGWHAFLALAGDEPAAAAAIWIDAPNAYLGFAGTRPEHRGKGGQGALFAARIARALEAGCTRLVTETGERRDDRPSSSYRNILRYGFEERFVVAHRLRRRAS
jgi:GNAT superfamily N-acetyltransferase